MARIGITGHVNLTGPTVPLVADAVRDALAGHDAGSLVGVTCLARGADQLFARVVLELGGTVEVVLPAADYRERVVGPDNATDFDQLIARAATVYPMPAARSDQRAYLAASEHLLSMVDSVLAVWDGEPGGYGGTADVVAAARERGLPVTVLWPAGSARV